MKDLTLICKAFLQASSNTSEAASAVEVFPLKRNGSNGPDAETEKLYATKSSLPGAASNERGEDVFMTPEELAFMRSLGWEETGDDAGGMSLSIEGMKRGIGWTEPFCCHQET